MPSAAARLAAEALLSLLKGSEPALLAEAAAEPLAERLAAREPDAVEEALLRAHLLSLPGRFRAWALEDRARVPLADGSMLSLLEAERRLADKEIRAPFEPLRRLISEATFPARERGGEAKRVFTDALWEVSFPLELGLPADAREQLDRALHETRDAAEACLAVLLSEGGAPLGGAAAMARALDLPDDAGGLSDAAARALGQALLVAARPFLSRGLVRIEAPRPLAGHPLPAARGPVRVAVAPALRAARFSALLEGSATALALAVFGDEALDEDARALGIALSLALASAPARRAVLGESRASAERCARILRARRLVLAYAQAAVARAALDADDDDGAREAARDALASALGADPPRELVDTLLELPIPGGARLTAPRAALLLRAREAFVGGALALALRERFDEAAPLVPAPYELLRQAAPALEAGALDALSLLDAGAPQQAPARMARFVAEAL